MSTKGLGVAQDYAEAVRSFQLAAAQAEGHASAQYNLGNEFFNILGVVKDDAVAIR